MAVGAEPAGDDDDVGRRSCRRTSPRPAGRRRVRPTMPSGAPTVSTRAPGSATARRGTPSSRRPARPGRRRSRHAGSAGPSSVSHISGGESALRGAAEPPSPAGRICGSCKAALSSAVMQRRTRRSAIAVLASIIGLGACGGDDGPSADDEREAVEHYAAGVEAAYQASLASATELDVDIDAFVADPTDETLEAAKQAWLTARDDYGLTEAFRFYGGPIDNEETGPEGRINAWPLDEAYIDYVEGDETAGVVNDTDDLPDDRRRVDLLAERAGRRGQHLDRLARHRVPAVGPGPVRRRAGRAPGHRLHRGAQRRPPRRPTSSPRPTSCSPTSRRWSTPGRPTPTTTGRRSSSRSRRRHWRRSSPASASSPAASWPASG